MVFAFGYMAESIITILIVGFIAGFVFSIPIAGPISILITSNALKGRYRYCVRAGVGASIGETLYVFLAVYGIAIMYTLYKPFVPYILMVGAIFLSFVGIKIVRTNLDLENLSDSGIVTDKLKNSGGFRTGLILIVTNPSLIVGWLTSSFLVFSFISSIGLNTGGLDIMISDNVNSISKIATEKLPQVGQLKVGIEQAAKEVAAKGEVAMSKLLLSILYSVSVAFGAFFWFLNFTKFLIRNRKRLNVKVLNRVIQVLGIALIGISVYLAVEGLMIII
jgi:threonine/homoserine/homoserine lactone efflux protein